MEGSFVDVISDFKNELTIEWPLKNIYPPNIVAQLDPRLEEEV